MALLGIVAPDSRTILALPLGALGTPKGILEKQDAVGLRPEMRVVLTGGAGGTFPDPNDVRSGIDYGPNGNDFNGDIVLPAESLVKVGTGYGADSTELTGTYVLIHGVGDDSQEEQTDAGTGRVIGGAAPAVPAVSSGGGRGKLRYRAAPVYVRQHIHGRGDSGQALQFSEGAGRVRVVRRGAGDSQQRRQESEGRGRVTFEAITERELLEFILIDAA